MILMSLWAILQSSRVTKVSEVPFLLQQTQITELVKVYLKPQQNG